MNHHNMVGLEREGKKKERKQKDVYVHVDITSNHCRHMYANLVLVASQLCFNVRRVH